MSDYKEVMTPKASVPLRVALIGAGRIGSSHAEIVANRLPGVELAMICDPMAGAAARLADKLSVPVATQSLDDVWNSDIDAVVIAAPARSHTDLVVAAAKAGKHVFVEKPMAVTLADADRAIAAVAIVLILGVVNMMRGASPNRSQTLMRWRVILQFAAIIVMMTALYLAQRH